MLIVLARHGESEANALGLFSNIGFKHGLTDKGREQASSLARAISDIGIERLYSSPLMRAVETSEIVAELLGLNRIIIDYRLREYGVGELEGKSDQASWDIFAKNRELWEEAEKRDQCLGHGETFNQVSARLASLLDDIQEDGKDSLLIGHGGLFSIGLEACVRNLSYAYCRSDPLGPAEFAVLRKEGDGLYCREWRGEKLR